MGGARVGAVLFVGYAFFNVLRKTWPSAIAQQSFSPGLGLPAEQVGAILSAHGALYGASKLGGSLLCDQ